MSKSRSIIISPERKEYLKQLSTDILSKTGQQVPVDLHAIADYLNVQYWYGDFKNEFMAELLFDGSEFYIAINNISEFDKDYGLFRYSFAHELGHYLIPEHRQGLMDFHKKMPPNTWATHDFGFVSEREAEYFAACLLMPEEEMKKYFGIENYSPSGFMKLRDHFKVSLMAILLRYVDLIPAPAALICTKQRIYKWHSASSPLNGFDINLPDGQHVHQNTLAGSLIEFMSSGSSTAYDQPQEIWLKKDQNSQSQSHEFIEILYYNTYNCLSIIRAYEKQSE